MAPSTMLHRVAEEDTPPGVEVPDNWRGLFIWAVGKFGGGIIIAAAFGYAASVVYRDDHALVERVMQAFEKRAEVDGNIAHALSENASILAALKEEIRSAHDRAAGKISNK